MLIGGLKKSSLLDYPNKIAAIVFTQGCNFRCGYCHNPQLTTLKGEHIIEEAEFFEFLKKRQGKLDGVVITGGEPTLQKDLREFILKIKEMDFLVKLDTNGLKPDVLRNLIEEKIVDYIAMDIKAPLEKYEEITNIKIDKNKILESINLILNAGIDYEFRTTIIASQLSLTDLKDISDLISGTKKYYLQKFVPSEILNSSLKQEKTYTDEEFENILSIFKDKIESVEIR